LTITNSTGYAMTINYNDSGSSGPNRIYTATNANVTCAGAGSAWCTLICTSGSWMLLGHS
jgi:hypothetical protein